jgi:cell division initiation protein
MNITGREINERQFRDAWRGYNQEEVDDFLDKIAETIEALQHENSSLRDRSHALEQSVATSREAEEMLKKTLVTAQRAAEEAIAKAKAKADQLVTEAERRARGANEEARKVIEQAEDEARRKALEIEREGESKRAELDVIIQKLSSYQSELQNKLHSFLDGQRKSLEELEKTETPAVARKQPPAPPGDGKKRPSGDERGDRVVRVDNGGSEKEPVAKEGAGATRRSVRSLFSREEG